MKKLFLFILFVIAFKINYIYSQDYLSSVTSLASGITTDNSKAWTDLTSVSIDVTNISYVLVSASINMRPDGTNNNGREANYNIYRSDLPTDNSGVIKRQMVRNSESGVESWGIGTLVHIFDARSLSGNITYTLEHSNQGGSSVGRNVFSRARLTALALTTQLTNQELSNSGKQISTGVDTTSPTFEPVTGLTTDLISLPIAGNIFVAASINSRANGSGSVAEYKLEYSTDGGVNWSDLGKPVKRSMINTFDDGIISLVGLLQNQSVGINYEFRVSHRRVSGTNTITTNNSNIVAIALTHNNGYFPSFYSEISSPGVSITGVSTPESTVTSNTFTSANNISGLGTNLFVDTQFLVNASGLNESLNPPQRMRARNQLFLDDGINPIQSADAYFRYIPDNSNFGSGGFIGLAEYLTEAASYTVSMKHGVEYISNPDAMEDETLSTSEVIFTGFQTYDQPDPSLAINDYELKKLGINLYAFNRKIYLKSNQNYKVYLSIYNLGGQLFKNEQFRLDGYKVLDMKNYSGVAIVKLKLDNKIYSKMIIL
jgi:hypothetical protein